MAEAAFNKKKAIFTSKLDLNLWKKLVECCIWSSVLYGAETWTVGKLYQKCKGSFETWCWRRVDKISGTDQVRNKIV